jgi:hypothetical protein
MISRARNAGLSASSSLALINNGQRTVKATPADNIPGGVLTKKIEGFVSDWDKAQRAVQKQIQALPADSRALVETQQLIHRLHLESELITRAADAASSTVRRLQQIGSS